MSDTNIDCRIDKVIAGLKKHNIDVSAYETVQGKQSLVFNELAHNARTRVMETLLYLRMPLYSIYKTMLK